ncbi:MAG: hypothetical protein LBS36_07505 [Oscillospiraceae bacterium]|jgi:hypothetical protein|nr:hypothetical protein [Oscillospiraceae bacterium]
MNTIHINQFNGGDDMAVFRAAASYLCHNPGTTLLLDATIYHLKDARAVELQRDIMRGKYTKDPEKLIFTYDFEYQIGIDLKGAEDIAIDGNGATLVFDGFMENISCQFCKNVTLKNFTIDLERAAFSRGKLLKSEKTAGPVPFIDVDFGSEPLLSCEMPTLRMLCVNTQAAEICGVTKSSHTQHLRGNIYRFYGAEDCGGDEVYLTHTFHYRPSILIYEAENTELHNITVHTHCGMGVVGHRSHDVFLDGLKVVPRAGYCMSTNTDATHFTSCTGLLRYVNCVFNGHGDDASNVHTYYHSVIKQEGTRYTLQVKAPTGTHCSKLDYFNVGDKIELCRFEDLTPAGVFTVKAVEPDFTNYTQIVEFLEDVPELEEDALFADICQLPRMEFLNCSVKKHLARAILVKTRDVLIEGNILDCKSWAGIHVAAEAFWHEGVTTENLIIRNNRILNYDTGISIEIAVANPRKPVHKNILIENNYIESGNDSYPITVKCAENLVIQNNELRSGKKGILRENCVAVHERNNVYVSGRLS